MGTCCCSSEFARSSLQRLQLARFQPQTSPLELKPCSCLSLLGLGQCFVLTATPSLGM